MRILEALDKSLEHFGMFHRTVLQSMTQVVDFYF